MIMKLYHKESANEFTIATRPFFFRFINGFVVVATNLLYETTFHIVNNESSVQFLASNKCNTNNVYMLNISLLA